METSSKNKLLDRLFFPLLVTVVGGLILLFIQFGFFADKEKAISPQSSFSNIVPADTISIAKKDKGLEYKIQHNHQLDRIQSLQYYNESKKLLQTINNILANTKLEKTVKSNYSDSASFFVNINGYQLELWQNQNTIGIGTLNIKEFKEFFISDEQDKTLLWFRNTKDTTDNPYPVIRAEFRFEKVEQIGSIGSLIYIKDGPGTRLDQQISTKNLENSLAFWNEVLKE